jgi:NAD+ diphosphatase
VRNQQLPPLARFALDRDYQFRPNPELFDVLWENQSTRVLAMHEGRVLLESGKGNPAIKLLNVDQVPTANLRVYLGKTTEQNGQLAQGSPIVLAVLNENSAMLLEPDKSNWHNLRSLGASLSDLDAGIFTQALALNNWHQSSTYCPLCGTPTVIEQGGWVRRCFKDAKEIFPRTDPAVIVSITDQDDRILLGSQTTWDPNRWSILAGFVEPGESLEAAVSREMKEESGLDVFDISYIYSQGWPYPLSLMLGFSARANSQDLLAPDGEEILKLRWFSRHDLEREAASLLLPGRSTISRAMIELWYGAEITSATEEDLNGQP